MGRRKTSRVSPSVEEEEAAEASEARGDDDGAGPTEKSLYEILGVERTASQQEIKKAYHKLALRLHPDKNPGDEEAKEKFQLLQKVMSILGDEEKRELYDRTGFVDDDDLVGSAAENLQEFFRAMYKRVTEADIEEFEANYRGSDSEKKDLKDLYKKFKGNMHRLFCSMLCSEPKLDSHRFKDIIDQAIDEGELKTTKAYQKWAKKVSETVLPTNPLAGRKSKKEPDTDLLAIISQRRGERKEQLNSLLSSIIDTCNGGEAPEPSEEEFQRARQRLESNKQGRKRRR
uniref:Chaperone protein dnaJ 6 n=1 Tax=Anthurium amnicola TaxID=1678845 RepID=A0A1D1YPG4_9ARAE